MKVTELKEELVARDEPVSGNKAEGVAPAAAARGDRARAPRRRGGGRRIGGLGV